MISLLMRILLFLLFLSSCQYQPSIPPNTLRICFSQNPTTLDPRKCSDFISSTLISLLYEGLTRCEGGSEITWGVAESVTISSDGTTYLFSLKEAYWSDGHLVSAQDFEKSWKQILTPHFPSPCAYLLYPIKNGERYAKGLCSIDEVGVHAINDHTLEVVLEKKTPYFLSLTAFPLYLPTPSHTEELVYNGPFTLEKMTLGREILLSKNPLFWNAPHISLSSIHATIVTSEMTALQLFEKGEVDIAGSPLASISIDSLPSLKKQFPFHFLPMAASTFCTMNTQTFPFSNRLLRKAFSLAIQNHPMLVEEILLTGQIPAESALPPILSSRSFTSYQPKEAQTYFIQALEELQISSHDLETLTLYYRGHPTEKKIAQTLQKIWKETLGVQIQLEQLDPKCLLPKIYAKNYQMALSSWIAQFLDPVNLLERFRDCDCQKNYPGWSSDLYKEALDEDRFALLEEILNEEAPLIPLYHWNSPMLIHPRVQGLKTTSVGGILFENCSILPELSSECR